MKDNYSKLIVNRILSLCKKREMSIYQLSMMSGVRYSTLDNILKGKTCNPKMKTLHKIATGFSMTLSELVDFEELNLYSFDDNDNDGD